MADHEHNCYYEQDNVTHLYCRCLCGWWSGPFAHDISNYFPKDKSKRMAWHPPEEDH